MPSTHAIRTRLALPLILLAYLIAGALYATSAPFLEVSDEVRHYAMVEHLAQGNGLPIQDEALNQRILDEERQARRPLTYYAQEEIGRASCRERVCQYV